MAPFDPKLADRGLAAPRPLCADEISGAQALVAEAGWNQTERDWRIFLDCGTVRAIRTRDGDVVATTATLPYRGFGWISMVLVRAAWRRQGLASMLLRGAIDDLVDAGLVPVLDATPAGREVYRTLGFRDTWGFARYGRSDAGALVASQPPPDGVDVQVISDATWPDLCAYDAAAFGADRGFLLACLRGQVPAADLVARRHGRTVGFLLGRRGRIATQLGPLIADDTGVARALLGRAIDAVSGPIFIDVADSKGEVRRFVESNGFASARPLTRMVHQRPAPFDDGIRTFVVVGPEFG
jgi:GNAT superfamily N-acetyltransferase